MPQKRNVRSEKMRNNLPFTTSSSVVALKLCDDPDNCGTPQRRSSELKFKTPVIKLNDLLVKRTGYFSDYYYNLDLLREKNDNTSTYSGINLLSKDKYVTTLSNGKIKIISGKLIGGLREKNDILINPLKIRLLDVSALFFDNTIDELNSFPFKFEITIYQEESDGPNDGPNAVIYNGSYATVILENVISIGTTKEIKGSCNTSETVTGRLFSTKDRTETCITRLGDNENILINRFLTLKNPDYYFTKDVGYYNPLDLKKAIINSRYLFTNNEEKITITSGRLTSGTADKGGFGKLPNTLTYNGGGDDNLGKYIYLQEQDGMLIINKPLNNYVSFDFIFEIKIEQQLKKELLDQFTQYTTSYVYLEFTRNDGDPNIPIPIPRCSVNPNEYPEGIFNCINYVG